VEKERIESVRLILQTALSDTVYGSGITNSSIQDCIDDIASAQHSVSASFAESTLSAFLSSLSILVGNASANGPSVRLCLCATALHLFSTGQSFFDKVVG